MPCVLALAAARRRDFTDHAAWMARNYALIFLAVTLRLVVQDLPVGRERFGARLVAGAEVPDLDR